jgi:hypothetical protein
MSVKKSEKRQKKPSQTAAAAGAYGMVREDGPGCSHGPRKRYNDSRTTGMKAGRGAHQAGARGSENKSPGASAGLLELEALVKCVEMFKNKMRELLERARETKRRDLSPSMDVAAAISV